MLEQVNKIYEAVNRVVVKLQPYAKTVVAVGGLLVTVGRAISDGQITSGEYEQIGVALGVVFGVFQVPNKK